MVKNYDVIVIGAGLAGLMAALTAAESQRNCLVVAEGTVTHFYSGLLDISHDQTQNVFSPETDSLVHPYELTGYDNLQKGLSLLLSTMAAGNNPYEKVQRDNFLLPTAVGTLRSADWVPASMAKGAIKPDCRVLIVGFKGFNDFSPELVAGNLARTAAINRWGILIKPHRIDVGQDLRGLNGFEVARLFEQAAFRQRVAQKLREACTGIDKVGFPAVLGYLQTSKVIAELEEILERPVFEIPSPLPSVPGMRMAQVLVDRLKSLGVKFLTGFRVAGEINVKEVSAVCLAAPGRSLRIGAEAYVLATGGICGGGLEVNPKSIRETVFGLPVTQSKGSDMTVKGWFSLQPYSFAGIKVNPRLQPIGDNDQVLLSNLYIAGKSLAGYDPFRERCGSGAAIATGYLAGELLKGGALRAEPAYSTH